MFEVIAAFREVMLRRPEAIALAQVNDEDLIEQLSYDALERQSGSLAIRLQNMGIREGEVVGLSCGRSIAHVIAMLALWKVHAAFVSLDPSLPSPRRQRIVEKANVRLFIDASLHISIEESGDAPLDLDLDLAYVCFSSGSTGEPKGIAVSHVGIVPMLAAQIEAFAMRPTSRALWLYSPSFDASISDIGTALLGGATLFISTRDLLQDTSALFDVLRTHRITHLDLPPSLLRHVALASLPALECVILGGESADVREVEQLAVHKRVINVYGPTEATVCTSLVHCDTTWTRPTIGHALPHIRYRIEGGDEGELWIAGPCLALGYLQDDALTASRFVMHEGERYFRTGDLVRRTRGAHGFEILGRLDRQRKIDGKIASPEEVERAFRELLGLDVCVVSTSESPFRLVAFITTEHDAPALREQLAAHLPPHLVPSRFVQYALPRNTSEKVDLQTLVAKADALFPPATPPLRSSSDALLAQLAGRTISGEMTLDALGLSSLDRVQLLASLRNEGRAISCALMRDATIDQIWSAPVEQDAATTLELTNALRGIAIEANSTRSRKASTKTIFITGATGFFGRHWLGDVLTHTPDHVICLVRAKSENAAIQRLFAKIELATRAHRTRIEVVVGDVADDHFGLSQSAYEALASRVDHVVHSAASMSVVESRQSLWNVNVLGTARVLDFVHHGSPKSLDYISTLAVLASTDRRDATFDETDDASTECRVFGGYAQTKWAAEQLVRRTLNASAQPVRIHRLGLLVGNFADSDWLSTTLRGLVQVGAYPTDLDPELAFDVTPVLDAARACHALRDAPSGTFHLRGRTLLFRDLVRLLATLGHPLAAVSRSTFRNLLAAYPGLATSTLQLAFERTSQEHAGFDLFLATRRTFAMTQTSTALALRKVPTPSLRDAALKALLRDILDTKGDQHCLPATRHVRRRRAHE